MIAVIHALWLRELKRYMRSRVQIVAALGQPVLYLLALGFGLGPVFQRAGEGNYIQFVAPGIIAMTVLFSSVFSGMGLLWDRQFGFLRETLVAPVPRIQIMFGRTLGAATVATCQGVLVAVIAFLAGFRVANPLSLLAGMGVVLLIALLFSALGTAVGSALENMQGFQIVMNFVVMPLFFLSGALFPLTNLPLAMNILTRLDPFAYGVDALRSVLIGVTHFGLALDLSVLAAGTVILLWIGSRLFARIQV